MESTGSLSSRFNGRALRQFAERVLDIATQSGVIIMPAALLFALFQFANGAMEAGLAGLVVAALAALGIYARLIEPYWLKVKRLEIGDSRFGSGSPHSSVPDLQASVSGSPGAKPLTVCFFS